MPFRDMPRYFLPPQTPVRGSAVLPPSLGRPRAILAPTANPLTGMPIAGPWQGPDPADMQPPPLGRGLPEGSRKTVSPDYKAPGADVLKNFQDLLNKYKLQSMADAMAAAQAASQSYGLFPTGVGLGLGFQRPVMDISSDQGRHARGFELLRNALEDAAPPVTIQGKQIGRNTHTTQDFVDALDAGQNFDVMGLSLADRERFKEAVQIKAWNDALKARRGF